MKLWLVRHARPLIDAGVCYGALDVPADDAATQECAAGLAKTLPLHARLITSPLQRCELLAHYLRGLRPDLSPESDARLAEMNFGEWEGQAWEAIGHKAIDEWTGQFATHRPGGGESVNTFMQRVQAAMADAQAENEAWITHAGVIRAATLIADGTTQLARADQWPKDGPAWGECRVLDI